MTQLTIKRVLQDNFGTHGNLYLNNLLDTFMCYTEELPWLDNEQGVSCIPDGMYECTRHNSPDHPNTWQVNNVPNRTEVLIHTGNTMKDTKGCILVGLIKTPEGVGNSVAALAYLNTILPETFTLHITTL